MGTPQQAGPKPDQTHRQLEHHARGQGDEVEDTVEERGRGAGARGDGGRERDGVVEANAELAQPMLRLYRQHPGLLLIATHGPAERVDVGLHRRPRLAHQ